ncbi:MAG TPA: methyltransferase domain-containing protein, partial [Ktedonobacterales bacterium]|nr:methyltransferase domain-containing protein [Ktedonobacterales bacterium]
MPNYLLDNAWAEQRRRLAGLEAWFDPGTIRHLDALGVAESWSCLEVGAGGGSIAQWLAARVGPQGQVVATDLDTRFLEALQTPNLEVRRHNILTNALPSERFDLVHARFVVEHLADRMAVLRTMAHTLKPGGWIMIEETDSASWVPDPLGDPTDAALFSKWTTAYAELLHRNGATAYAGRRLHHELRTLGLEDIGAEGRVFMVQGGSWPAGEVWQLTAAQVSEAIVGVGLLTAEEMAQVVALLGDPRITW